MSDSDSTVDDASGSDSDATRVAIACQGGGSHTAFTAGVLMELLDDWDDNEYELVGISGSSGGAFNALAAWYGLLTEGPDAAIDILDALWDDLAATTASDRWLNAMVKSTSRLRSKGVGIPRLSPYHVPGSEQGKQAIRDALEAEIDFDAIPDLCQRDAPELVVGTVNVNAGVFETFTNEEVTVDAVLASAAVPDMFEAVELHGHAHWDGLFSQNPPVNDLMHVPGDRKPEELWIIQVNPQEFEGVPKSMDVIDDRRNELSGNISLNQELGFIERVNQWVEDGKLPADEFQKTAIRHIPLDERYHSATKADRDPAFIDGLVELGRDRATTFLQTRE